MGRRWKISPNGYAYCYEGGRKLYQHRVVWEEAHGPLPSRMHVHHKNHDKLDNRLENLEALTGSEHRREHVEERPLTCTVCGCTFVARHGRALYCKPCGSKMAEASRVLVERDCIVCGRRFSSRRGTRCSQQCVNRDTWARAQSEGGRRP